ncbi:SLC13 family permease [Halomonas llamarensis]|uniref:SLC13 family permease n=1 Tax=Halomonas llamarensis TaxID=2945104 RepID=A0ABT0SLY5_9GAMM|nr:SLC13 family permease [Halomonas llamarensis]MCL7928588.1 SLC13 family permease [Halomonas llamarensis]
MAWLALLSLFGLLAILLSGRVAPAVAFTSIAVLYALAGWVETPQLLNAYTNPALVTLLVLLMVSQALERSPWLTTLSKRLMHGSERHATAKLVGASAVLSAFFNNTAVVAGLMSAVAKQPHFAPSRLLLPLSFAAVLGGITTLVGTSTNLVVNSFAVEATGVEFSLFQFSWVGVPVALLSLGMLIWQARGLPHHAAPFNEAALHYFAAAQVTPDSPMIGHSIEANGLRQLEGLYLLEIEREGRLITPVGPDMPLQASDTLAFTGDISKLHALQRFPGLALFGHSANQLLTDNLVEVVLSHDSPLIHQTLQNVDFRSRFDAGVVAIRRGNQRLKGQLGRIPLKAGDCLLIAIGPDFHQHHNITRNFYLLDDSLQRPSLGRWQNLLAVGGFALTLIAAATQVLPLLHGLLLLLGALLLSGTLQLAELRRRFPFTLWLTTGSALAIAHGLSQSGGAEIITHGVQALFSGYGVYAAFVGCYLLTWLLTETVTNNAAAALSFPVAWATAQSFGADPAPFMLAVAYGASACFLLPFGYQTHLMVYSTGQYRLKDIWRLGWPVSLVYSVGVLVLTPWMFPFG